MKLKLLAPAAMVMFLLCSCAGLSASPVAGTKTPGATASAPPVPPPNYLAAGGNGTADGSWAIDMDIASGTLYESQLEGQQVLTANGTVGLQGSSLTIEVQAPQGSTDLLGSGTYAATTSGGDLQVAVPWSDGSVHTYPFSQQTLDAYNSTVAQLNNGAQQAVTAAQQAAAAQQAQQQAAAAQQQAAAARLKQQEQAAAATLVATATQSCSAVGGQIQNTATGVTVTINADGTQSVFMAAYCVPGSGRTWQPSYGSPLSCDGLSVPFNDDGTLNQGDLQSTKSSYPGCFG